MGALIPETGSSDSAAPDGMGPIVHITRYFSLNTFGGVERYVGELHEHLLREGVGSAVIWLSGGGDHQEDLDHGRFALRSPASRFEPPDGACREAFEKALAKIRPALAHFHTFGRSEAACAEILSARGVPCVFTYHTPSCSCRRGTLLLWGKGLCDGKIDATRCLACKINERSGLPPVAAGITAQAVALTESPATPSAGPWLMRREIRDYATAFRHFLETTRSIITHGDWVAPVLIANGARPEQIRRIEMGADAEFQKTDGASAGPDGNLFAVGYVGRLEPTKGPQLLIEAFKSLDYDRAKLLIFGGDNSKTGSFERRLRELANGDPRIEFRGRVAYDQMPAVYADLSLVAIPSVWYETGPFVLREALAQGIPVAASPTVGDPGLVRRAGGWVLPASSVDAWRKFLGESFASHRAGKWKQRCQPVDLPTTADMYAEITRVYDTVRHSRAVADPVAP